MLWLCGMALASTVYINGVQVDTLPVVTLYGATVRMDQDGNVWIDAPNYKVQVVGGGGTPVAPSTAPALSSRTWYLVSEDEGSSGGIVDVYVNDQYVRRLQSGSSQLLMDVSSYVRRGANKVQFVVRTAPIGRLSAYVGVGDDSTGAIRIDAPPVTWRSPGSPQVQEYTFTAQ